MRFFPLLVAMTLLGCGAKPPVQTPAAVQNPADAAVDALAAEYWAEAMRVSPVWATYLGDRSRDAELGDLSAAARTAHDTALQGLLDRLGAVDTKALSQRSALIGAVLRSELEDHFRSQVCAGWEWDVDQLYGLQVWLAELPNHHVVDGEQRARDLIERYWQFGAYFAQHQNNLRGGVKSGRTAARINVVRVIEQLDRQLAVPLAEQPYVAPVVAQVEKLGGEPYPGFLALLPQVVEAEVLPALRGYRNFLEREILPHSRNRPGVDGLRDGAACYQAMIASHTGLEETPEAIHQLGLQEVARIQAEMQTLATEMGAADPAALMAALDARPDQHAADAEALLAYNRDLLARAQAALPRVFGRLPKTPIELKALEAFRAADAPAAYYYGAPDDGSRPAYYYLNTHDATERLLYQMPALAFHEAVPGHHLQIALAKETLDLPMFMRESGNSAFTEGWALYAERLARELDLYRTPEERFGALTYEIWRAARLVVDTGLHAKGWRRQEAIDYLNGLLGHDEGEIINEVDRYIAWPGQALAYKVGELEIRRLRAEAEAARGTNFDLRAFHDRVLRNGSVPLRVLRADIEAWLKE